jgi:general secretion pathway protein I
MIGREGGFTIIETLVALAILGVALVTLYGAGANALRATQHTAKVDQAILLAQSKLDEIQADNSSLPSQSKGTFAGTGIAWQLTAQSIPSNEGFRRSRVLQSVVLDVSWHDGINEQSISVETRHMGDAGP